MCVVIMFFLHSWIHEWVDLSLAWIAIIGAMVHLVASGIREIDHVLEKVEFSTLIFFAGLFVLMRGLEELGVMHYIGEQISHIIVQVPPGKLRLTTALVLIVWGSAIVSAFIDNIPYTTAMVPIVAELAETYAVYSRNQCCLRLID
jgi:P protein